MKINKIRIEGVIGVILFFVGLQILSSDYLRVLPIDAKDLFGNVSYFVGVFLIINSFILFKSCLTNKKTLEPQVDIFGVFGGLVILALGSNTLRTGWLHSKGGVFYLEEARYFVGIALILCSLYMLYHAVQCLWVRNVNHR